MLYIPGYIKIDYDNENLILSSLFHKSKIRLSNKEYIDEFLNIKNNKKYNENSELVVFLKKHFILTSKSDIYNNIDNLYDILEKQLILTILPTEKCNFNCTYCYEDFKHGTISCENIDIIKEFIYNKLSSLKHKILYINWFGGEPTLCHDIIIDMNKYANSICNKFNIQFSSSMTTNGYLLNELSFIDYFNSGIKLYQITIDGFNHDKKRPTIDGKGTLSTILNNLKNIKLLANNYDYKIYIRYNILKTDTDLSWYDELKKLFGNDNRFFLIIREVSDLGGDKSSDLSLLDSSETKEILNTHISYAHSLGFNLESDNEEILFNRICYASRKNSFVFRSNGLITKCTINLNEESNIIGKYNENIGVEIEEKKNKNWYKSKISDKCLTCNFILSCLKKSCYKYDYCYKKRYLNT